MVILLRMYWIGCFQLYDDGRVFIKMLVDYKGRRFRVSERTFEYFMRDYPDRCSKLQVIDEGDVYYNYDKLKELISPDDEELKVFLLKKFDYYVEEYNGLLMSDDYVPSDDLDIVYGKIMLLKEICRDLFGVYIVKELDEKF